MHTIKKLTIAVAAVSALGMTAACGSSSDTSSASSDSSTTTSQSPEETPMKDDSAAADPMANLVGSGCADYAKAVPEGAGSVEGMSTDPVAVAASNNPVLKTLTAAVSGKFNPKVNLVDTLNGGEFTVFAPTDDAFAKIDKKTLGTLAKPAGAEALTSVLTYHVVEGQMTPDEVAGKTLTTVQGDKLKITGSGDSLKSQDANVVCGGVQTANATVYLIDSVMMPPSM